MTPFTAWRGFDAAIFLQGVGEADGYIAGAARHAYISEGSLPQEIYLDCWTPTNTGASYVHARHPTRSGVLRGAR